MFFFNAANCYWVSKSATTMFRALPGTMSPPTASVFPGSSFSVSFFSATNGSTQILISYIVFVFRNECWPIVCNSASLSLRERGMYENAHRKTIITTTTSTKITTTQARLNEYSVPKMILICCLVSKQESQLQTNSTYLSYNHRLMKYKTIQVAVIPPIPLLFDHINMV